MTEETVLNNAIKKYLKFIREENDWTQTQLAEKSGIGITTIRQYESKPINNISMNVLLKLSEMLKQSLRKTLFDLSKFMDEINNDEFPVTEDLFTFEIREKLTNAKAIESEIIGNYTAWALKMACLCLELDDYKKCELELDILKAINGGRFQKELLKLRPKESKRINQLIEFLTFK